jgi:predicted Zn finger-like uncharacterized protein
MGLSLGNTPMSKTTRCPSCATVFRVIDAQLHASAGRVRCGRCGTTFDALASLAPENARSGAADSTPATRRVRPVSETFDFGPQARTGRTWGWWVATVTALFALALQLAYHYRTEVGLVFPEVKPLIQLVCAELACEVPLPRRAELLSIESSDLQADSTSPNVMVLTATLRNRAGFSQAFPLLELSLTSAQDRTIARRVLNPKDYVPRGTQTSSGFAAGSELSVRVYIEAASLRPTGYRLYLFYS